MAISTIVNGAKGRMGQLAVQTLSNDLRFNLVAELDQDDDLAAQITATQAQVVIDFTKASMVYENCQTILQTNARPVIGTSGLTTDQVTKLSQLAAAQHLGGIIVPNFSLGAVLMMQFAALAARHLDHVEILEYHHDKKQDSPSGTALRTAEMIAAGKNTITLPESRQTLPGARGATYEDIAIHAIRLPGLLAHQTVLFGNTGETLSIRHDSLDRSCFAKGIALACEKVIALDTLVVGLEAVL